MYDNNNKIPVHCWILPFDRFRALTEQKSLDVHTAQYRLFEESTPEGSKIWMGKFRHNALSDNSSRYCQEFLDVLSMKMYALFGVQTLKIGLCPQPVPNFMGDHSSDTRFLHVFYRCETGVRKYATNFPALYRAQAATQSLCYRLNTDEGEIPLRGFGAALAVAYFLHDQTSINNTGDNISWVIRRDDQNNAYAQTIKTKSEMAFHFLRSPSLNAWISTDTDPLHYEDLMPDDQCEFISTLEKITNTSAETLYEMANLACIADGLSRDLVDMLVSGLIQRQNDLLTLLTPGAPSHDMAKTSAVLSLLRLRELQPQALSVLQNCIGLLSNDIPLILLTDIQQTNLNELLPPLTILSNYHLLHWDPTKNTITIHQSLLLLLDELWTDLCDRENHLKKVAAILTKRLDYPANDANAFSLAVNLVAHALHTIDILPITLEIEKAHLLRQLGRHYAYHANDRAIARRYLEQALAIYASHYGPNHPEVAKVLINLSNTYSIVNIEKIQLLERALTINKQSYNESHPMIAITHINLSKALVHDPLQQKMHLEQALVILKNHYKDQAHPLMATTLSALGDAYGALKQMTIKKNKLEESLNILEQFYPPKHPEIAVMLTKLSHTYGMLGYELPQQKKLLERALVINTHCYGKEHSIIATTLSDLSDVYGALGYLYYKQQLLDRALVINERCYGKHHLVTALALINLGNTYGDLGYAPQQKIFLEQAINIIQTCCGSDHPALATALCNLGGMRGELIDASQKKHLLETALSIAMKHYGSDHPIVATIYTHLGHVYYTLGLKKESCDYLVRALAIKNNYYPKDHIAMLEALISLGISYYALNDIYDSQKKLKQALNISMLYYHKNHPIIGRIHTHLSDTYRAIAKIDTSKIHPAKRSLEKALEIQRIHYGCKHVALTVVLDKLDAVYDVLQIKESEQKTRGYIRSILNNHSGADYSPLIFSGIVYYGYQGDMLQHKKLLESFLTTQESHPHQVYSDTRAVKTALGSIHHALGNAQASKRILEEALSLYDKGDLEFAITLINLASVNFSLNKLTSAFQQAKICVPIFQKFLGETDQNTLFARYLIEKCEQQLINFTTASTIVESQFSPGQSPPTSENDGAEKQTFRLM